MKDFKNKVNQYLRRAYGFDELSQHLYYVAIVLFVITLFYRNRVLTYISLFVMLLSMFRSLSQKRSVRLRELALYRKYKRKVFLPFKVLSLNIKERKVNKYIVCKKCGTILRIPRGKKEIVVTCSNCRFKFDAKS